MRNLQKILALALALIMSFSLVVTANAAFSDEADITDTYNESVNVLSQLEVFKGYTDGTYQPQKSITRAEVAAIIYRIATGDVADTQVSIYSDWNRFSDVHTGEWWAGYINYCANAEYIKGYGNGKFGPDDPVTGYEALAMILRAVGYGKMEGEFQGSDWAVQTAARANTLGVTRNVQNTALLNSAATRELVAELLFRSILVPTVTYNQFSGYTETGTNLAYESFQLEQVEGVVVANEWANLYDTEVLADGKTQLEVAENDIRNLDYVSGLTDIGESRYAYIRNSQVLALADTGKNVVWETGDSTNIDTDKKFRDKSGLDKTDATEFYEDFGHEGHYSSDYRLEFKVTFEDADAKADFEKDYETGSIDESMERVANEAPDVNGIYLSFTCVIRAEEEISQEQLNIMRGIFAMADEEDADDWNVKGEVYAGTRSLDNKDNRYDDLSDTISYRTFYRDYINDQAWDQDIEGNGNGEWLKIVDNDSDGKADYAFLTHYYLDRATGSYTKSGTEYLEYETLNVERFEDNDGIVVYLDEVSVDDVIIYTKIDNKLGIELAEVLTDKINSVSFRDETVTTVGGETKGQSDIYNQTDMDEIITAMEEDLEYNMYLDKYGYIRAYELAAGTQYALLTELYYTRGSNVQYVTNEDLTVELKAADAKIDEFDVLNSSGNDFSIRNVDGWTNVTSWDDLTLGALGGHVTGAYKAINTIAEHNIVLQPATRHLGLTEEVGDDFFDPALTNVAKYVMTDKGVRIESASRYAQSTKNEQLYYANYQANGISATNQYDVNGDGRYNTGDKITEADWRAWYRANVDTTVDAAGLNTAWNDADLQKVYSVDYINLDPNVSIDKSARRYDIDSTDEQYRNVNNGYVNAIHSTEYYIVNQEGSAIRYFTDYTNVPEINASNINAVYAVARNTTANNLSEDYWVADVIVIEVDDSWKTGYESISFLFDNFQQTSTRTKFMDTLNNESEDPRLTIIPTDASWGNRWSDSQKGFYLLDETEMADDGILMVDRIGNNGNKLSTDWDKYGIYAGRVARVDRVSGEGNYLMAYVPQGNGAHDGTDDAEHALTKQIPVDRANVYGIDTDEAKVQTLTNREESSDIKTGDLIIWVENDKGDVAYIIDVTDDNYDDGTRRNYSTPAWMDDLWDDIWAYEYGSAPIQEEEDKYTVSFVRDEAGDGTDALLPDEITDVAAGSYLELDVAEDGYTVDIDIVDADGDTVAYIELKNGNFAVTSVDSDLTVTVTYTASTVGLKLASGSTITSATQSFGGATPTNLTLTDSSATNVKVGTEVVLTISATAGKTTTVTVPGADVTDNEDGTYTFDVPWSETNVEITVTVATISYSITPTITGGGAGSAKVVKTSTDSLAPAEHNGAYSITVTPEVGYALASTDDAEIKVGNTALVAATDYTVTGNAAGRVYAIAANKITDEVTITFSTEIKKSTITFTVNSGRVYDVDDNNIFTGKAISDVTVESAPFVFVLSSDELSIKVEDTAGTPNDVTSKYLSIAKDGVTCTLKDVAEDINVIIGS